MLIFRFLAVSLVFVYFCMPLLAATPGANCAAIANDLTRLACYDRALGLSPTPDLSPADHWDVTSTKSDFTDQTDVYLVTTAANGISCGARRKPTLYVRCLDGKTSVFVSHGCYAPADRKTQRLEVQHRIDDAAAGTFKLAVSTSDNAFGWWNDSSASSALTNYLLDRDQLVLRFAAYRKAPSILKFDLSGLRDTMASTTPSCDWARYKPKT